MEQRTPVSVANEEDLRPRLFEYEGLLCNRHPVSIEAKDYENSTEAVSSSGNHTCRVDSVSEGDCDLESHNSTFQLDQLRGELTDGHPGCTQLLQSG